jgi:hypothetical protein
MFEKEIDNFIVPSLKFQKIYSDFLKSTGDNIEYFNVDDKYYEISSRKIYQIVHIDNDNLFLLAMQNLELLTIDLIKNIVYFNSKKELPGSALKTFEAPLKVFKQDEFKKKFKKYYIYQEIVEKLYHEYKGDKLKLLVDLGQFCTTEEINKDDQSEDLLWLLFFLYKNQYQIKYDIEKDEVVFEDYKEKNEDKIVI